MSVRSVQKRHKWALDFSKHVFRLVIILFILVFEDYVYYTLCCLLTFVVERCYTPRDLPEYRN